MPATIAAHMNAADAYAVRAREVLAAGNDVAARVWVTAARCELRAAWAKAKRSGTPELGAEGRWVLLEDLDWLEIELARRARRSA